MNVVHENISLYADVHLSTIYGTTVY